jgi:hypothetical protein
MRKIYQSAFLYIFVLLVCVTVSNTAWSLTIKLTDPKADFFADGNDPCPRDPAGLDDCWVRSFLNTNPANETWDLWKDGWNAWNNTQPEGKKWELIHGAFLYGTLNITTFDTFNNCPGTGGVEVRAYFVPEDGDPTKWYWAQALYYNYEVGGSVPDHDSSPPAARHGMDISPSGTPADHNAPPLYPYQYSDGHFYDRPRAYCLDESTVFFNAIAMIVNCDYENRKLTAYEGFSYGWNFNCIDIPEPATLLLLGLGGLALLRRRR